MFVCLLLGLCLCVVLVAWFCGHDSDETEALTKFIIPSCDPEKDPTCETDKDKAWAFVLSLNATMLLPAHEMELKSFIYDTNLTKYNEKRYQEIAIEVSRMQNNITRMLKGYAWNLFEDRELVKMAEGYYLGGVTGETVKIMKRV